MRQLPISIASALEAGAAHLCHVVILTRKDGQVLGFSDHDQVLIFKDISCLPNEAISLGAASSELGVDGETQAAFAGCVSASSIRAADIKVGLYDEARLDTYIVNWQVPSDYVLTGSGFITEIECRGGIDDEKGQFIAHVAGLNAPLDRVIGRQYSHLCDAALGDDRCGLSASVIAGRACDKRYATCRDIFENRLNFRGFPDIPGEDYLSLYPQDSQTMDGRSRAVSSGR